MRNATRFMAMAGMLLASVSGVQAGVVMEWVTVGDPGNAPDTRYETPGYGGVGEVYRIGKYEVTNSQYTEFLKAVAATDTHWLYNTAMGSGYGGIKRSGSSGSYTYSTIAGRGNMPVNYVSWYDTLRFANWMHNGQGSGNTEDGAYDMSFGTSVVRKPGALVFLPSEDEWYKAAYYKGGGSDAGYWVYPTGSDDPPRAEVPPGTDLVNGSANYDSAVGDLTNVGAYTAKFSGSAYGTLNQGGNVWEWNEADIYGDGLRRGRRGGWLESFEDALRAEFRYGPEPWYEHFSGGFRVAAVPEPECIDPPSDMVAWWPLDEQAGATAHDIEVGHHDGTHVGWPTPDPAGKVDGALSFDGEDDYVEVWDDGALDFGMGEGTIDAWVKKDAGEGSIVVKGWWPSYYFEVVGDGHVFFAITDDFICWDGAVSEGTVNDGNWHHVAATLSRFEEVEVALKVYIDGVLDGTMYHEGPVGYIGSPDEELLIGATPGGEVWRFFDGVMDEIEIFNRPLEQWEIKAIFDADSAGKCRPPKCIEPLPGAVAWYPFDEPVGPIAHDIVGGNDGTHVDEPTPVPAGMVDGALGFDGVNDYVEVWDDGALDFGMGDGTIDAWIKTEADDGAIVVNGSSLWYYFDVVSDGHLWFGICDDAHCYLPPAETAGTVNDGNWHHVAATLSRSGEGEVTLDVYIDGVWDGTTYHEGPVGYLGSPDQELLIGARPSVPGYVSGFFAGVIDEMEIFNRALAPEEIWAIFDAGSAGRCKPPDCNANGVPDDRDIAEGTSKDCQPDEIPDECQLSTRPPCCGDGYCVEGESYETCPDDCPLDATCEHSITMWDDYGDGWNGGYIDVYVDGELVLAGVTLASGAGPETVYFPAAGNGNHEIVWTPGGWPQECWYCVYDVFGVELGCDGQGGVEPTGISFTGNCEEGSGLPINDCNENGVPDDCDLDCNDNCIPDDCEDEPVTCGDLDLKPGLCPNSFNRGSHGVLPIALLGSEFFDLSQVDIPSIRLWRADGVGAELAPHEGPPGPHTVFKDVATPFEESEVCECADLNGDGIDDLSMKFKTDDVVAALELDSLPAGALVELVLTGCMIETDPQCFTSPTDCLRLVPPGTGGALLSVESSVAGAWIGLDPLDETLDGGGFADFERTFPLTTVVTLTAEEWAEGRPLRGWQIGGLLHHMGETTVGFTIDQDMTASAVYGPTPSGSPKPPGEMTPGEMDPDGMAPESFIQAETAGAGAIDHR